MTVGRGRHALSYDRGMRSRLVGLVAAVCAAVVLAGCAPASAPVPPPQTASATPTPTTSAAPEPTPDPTPSAAVTALDGDCAAVLPDEAADEILGLGARQVERDASAPNTALMQASMAASGGLTCGWDAGAAGTLSASILPVDIISPELLESTEPMVCVDEAGSRHCTVAVAAGDTWLQVSAQDETTAQQALAAIGARIVDQHPQAAGFPADSWATPACDAVVRTVGEAAGVEGMTDGYPSDANPGGMLWDALAAHGVLTYCGASTPDASVGVRVRVYSGFAADALRALDLPAAKVTNADEAYRYSPENEPAMVFAIVGENVLSVSGFGDVDFARIAGALIPTMQPRPADA